MTTRRGPVLSGPFDAFVEAGGNFVDTANRYAEGTSEKYVGEFIAADRDHFLRAKQGAAKIERKAVSF